jgi:predicted phage tail protein
MPISYKILGQALPTATANVELYKVPAGAQTVVSTINVCNQSAGLSTFRIGVRAANVAETGSQFIAYNTAIGSGDAVVLSMGMTLGNTGATGDTVYVWANTSSVSFNLFGSEIT